MGSWALLWKFTRKINKRRVEPHVVVGNESTHKNRRLSLHSVVILNIREATPHGNENYFKEYFPKFEIVILWLPVTLPTET